MVRPAQQYDRSVRVRMTRRETFKQLTINPEPRRLGAHDPHLRVRFRVTKDVGNDLNRGEVEISNLAQRSREHLDPRRILDLAATARLALAGGLKALVNNGPAYATTEAGGAIVAIDAGYDGTVSQLMEGTAVGVSHDHVGVDWLTRLEVVESGFQISAPWFNRAYESGVTAYRIIADAVAIMGLRIHASARAKALLTGYRLDGGFTAWGRPAMVIADLLVFAGVDEGGLQWWIDDGALRLTVGREALLGVPVVVTSNRQAGSRGVVQLLSHPRRMEGDTVAIRSLLAPSIMPGARVDIVSSDFAGGYRCAHVEHVGDNFSGAFETQAVLEKLDLI